MGNAILGLDARNMKTFIDCIKRKTNPLVLAAMLLGFVFTFDWLACWKFLMLGHAPFHVH